MTRLKVSLLCVMTVGLALATIPLKASDPVGIYALIDKVVLEPNGTEPTSVQIWGAFSVAVLRGQTKPAVTYGDAPNGDLYGPVQVGYLYYICDKGKISTCAAEWSDLKSVAGKDTVVGFGSRWVSNGRVRPASQPPAQPDSYALNVGVVKIGGYGATGMTNRTQYPDLIAALNAAKPSK